MANAFLIVIYATFVSIGLPTSVLGVVWPAMQKEFNVSYSFAGFISMAMTAGTILMSVLSIKLIRRFGTGKIILISTLTMGVSLLGYYFAPSFVWALLLACPLGLGLGTIDCGINAFMAQHYKSHHMNWLHCFWGVGAMLGPIVMAMFISNHGMWREGYLAIAIFQFVLAGVLLFTLPLWDKVAILNSPAAQEIVNEGEEKAANKGIFSSLKISGVKYALLTCLLYCGVESTFGLWGSSFLIKANGVGEAAAAAMVSFFFGSIAAGRLLSGFVAFKLNDKTIIRIAEGVVLIGALLIFLPNPVVLSAGIILLGIGCGPLFPSLLHQTPALFGKENAQATVSLQVGVAYVGSTLVPPAFGFTANATTMHIFPIFLLAFILMMFLSSERMNSLVGKKLRKSA